MFKSLFSVLFLFFSALCLAQEQSYNIPDAFISKLSDSQYKSIAQSAIKEVAKVYTVDSFSNATIFIKPVNNLKAFNLDNLLLKCLATTEDSWNHIIVSHFSNLFSSIRIHDNFKIGNYDSVAPVLTIRVYPENELAKNAEVDSLISCAAFPGTIGLVLIETPVGLIPAKKSFLSGWNREIATVIEKAKSNVAIQKISRFQSTYKHGDYSFEMSFIGSDEYAASYAMNFDKNCGDLIGKYGSIVTVPTRGVVTSFKLEQTNSKLIDAVINFSYAHLKRSFNEGKYPVSDSFFWIYEGKFFPIEVQVAEASKMTIVYPNEMKLKLGWN